MNWHRNGWRGRLQLDDAALGLSAFPRLGQLDSERGWILKCALLWCEDVVVGRRHQAKVRYTRWRRWTHLLGALWRRTPTTNEGLCMCLCRCVCVCVCLDACCQLCGSDHVVYLKLSTGPFRGGWFNRNNHLIVSSGTHIVKRNLQIEASISNRRRQATPITSAKRMSIMMRQTDETWKTNGASNDQSDTLPDIKHVVV